MADRRALVITSPGVIGLQAAAELVPGPGEVVARPVHTGRVSLLDAALAEPAAVAWRAIGRGQPQPGERIAVVATARWR